MNCTYCGSHFHPTSFCPKTWDGQSRRIGLKCSYCGQTDHSYEACPKIHAKTNTNGIRVFDK